MYKVLIIFNENLTTYCTNLILRANLYDYFYINYIKMCVLESRA
jgi:hypothetical protein